MVDAKTIIVSAFAVLSAFLLHGIRAQMTIDYTSEGDSCSRLEEGNMRRLSLLENEGLRTKTLENVSDSQAKEIQRLKLDLENERRRPATLIRRFETGGDQSGMTKVGDRIYVMGERRYTPNTIQVFEDRNDFRFIRNIQLNGTGFNSDIVYSNQSKCIYISDYFRECIWMMTTTGEHQLTKWLTGVVGRFVPKTLSFSNEGHLLVLREQSPCQLEIYALNATLVRRLQLPQYIKNPKHVVQTSAGNFIICHQLNNVSNEPWVISQLKHDGKLVNRFIPKDRSQIIIQPEHLFLDSDNNRLFVVDCFIYRVILFDSNVLTWSQVLLSDKRNGIVGPWRLFYDSSKKHLLVAGREKNVHVFEIN